MSAAGIKRLHQTLGDLIAKFQQRPAGATASTEAKA